MGGAVKKKRLLWKTHSAVMVRVVGVAPGKAATLPPLPTNLPKSREEALSFADNNPEVVAANFTEAELLVDIDVAKSLLYPQLSASASASRQDQPEGTTWSYARNSAQGMVQLAIPVYDGGDAYSKIRGAKQAAQQAHYDVLTARNKVVDQIDRAWQRLVTAKSQIVSITEQRRAAEVALESVSREAAVGTRTVLDQLNAEQELLDAKIGLVRAQHDEGMAAYGLLLAIGRVNPDALKMAVDVYDPTVNYEDVRGRWFGTDINGESHSGHQDSAPKGLTVP